VTVQSPAQPPSQPPAQRRRPAALVAAFAPKVSQPPLVASIGLQIVSGALAPGQPLNEAAMRDRFGVSRTALREAYSQLTAKGLVTARPRVGTTVRERRHWNMLDPDVLSWHLQTVPAVEIATHLYALRRMVEPSAAGLAATARTDADLAAIYAAYDAMEANAAREADLVEADYAFHLAILTATQNPFISGFSALIHAAMVSTFELSWRGAQVIRDQRLSQHRQVADAIRDHDPVRASRLMSRLLEDAIADVRQAVQAPPAGPAAGSGR
jgi:DNA-binding FadR family transcriptional regulator